MTSRTGGPSDLPTDPHEPRRLQPPAELLAEGRMIAGRYEVKGRLGAGGMGTVYRVRDRTLGEDVALKVLRAERLGTPADRERFLGEARLARRITHPNVCRVFDVGAEDGLLFLTMELVPGRPLRALLREGPLPFSQARWIWEQMARGVAAAHEQGIVHRDLKPENVLVQPDGRVKVADFGLAIESDAATATGAGTPPYMSPEQLRGEPLDARSDVFSLGVVGHETLAGRHPFGDGPPAVVISAILRDPPLPIDVPPPVAALLQRAMARSREERFATAGELADALAELGRSSSPALARTTPIPALGSGASAPREARRWWRRPALLAAPLAAIALGVLTWTRLHDGDTVSPPPPLPGPTGAPARTPAEVASPGIVVSSFQDLSGSAWSVDLARSAEEAVRAGLREIKGLSVLKAPEPGAWIAAGSVQRAGEVVRIQMQIDRGPGKVGDPFEVEGANDLHLLDAVRDRTIDEVRILLRDHARRASAVRDGRSDAARRDMLAYYNLIGPAPRPRHVAAGMPLLDRVLAAEPEHISAHIARAYLLLLRASMEASREDLAAAGRDIIAVRTLAPAEPQGAVLQCRWSRFSLTFETAVSDAAMDEAQKVCNAALRADPQSAAVYIELAKLHEQSCREDQALQHIEVALSLDRAKAGEILRYRAELAFLTDRMQLAEEASRQLVRLQEDEARLGLRSLAARAGVPPTRGAHWLRGSVLLRLGRRDEARAAFERELREIARYAGELPTEAAAIRGLLLAVPPTDKVASDLTARLREIEAQFAAEAAREPTIALDLVSAYMFIDAKAALAWLGRLDKPATCEEAQYRALVHHIAGDDAGAQRVLAVCKPATRWEARCATGLRGRLAGPDLPVK